MAAEPLGASAKRSSVTQQDGPHLFAKLRRLDPDICEAEYLRKRPGDAMGGEWDTDALVEDERLTSEVFSHDSLEKAVAPIRLEMKALTEEVPGALGGAVLVSTANSAGPPLLLADAKGAQQLDRLRQLGVRRIVNCSPQTVKTGPDFYGAGVAYLELWTDDLLDYCLMQDIEAVQAFVSDGGPCLLHCEQGVNRSGALVVALSMLRLAEEHPAEPPEELLRLAWRGVVERKGKVLTNHSFQRQLLLFARTGLRWFPSLDSVWRSEQERAMARFRTFAEKIAWSVVAGQSVPEELRWRMVVFVRDGSMRGEQSLRPPVSPYDLSTKECAAKAERRVKNYAVKSLSRKVVAR